MIIIKLICLFFAIWITLVNISRIIMKNSMPVGNLLLQALSIFGYVVLQFKLY